MTQLDKLRHALAVANLGTFSRAARSIPISQPALTRSVQALERQYGVILFERGRGGAVPTQEGRAFLDQARRLVRHADAVEDNLRRIRAGLGARVSFGMGPASARTFLTDALAAIVTDMPDLRLRVRTGTNSDLRELVRSGEIAFYVGGIPVDPMNAVTDTDIVVEPIGVPSRLRVLVRRDHPLCSDPTRDMSTFPVASGSFIRDALSEADAQRLGLPRPTIEVDDYAALLDLARHSDVVLITSSIFDAASGTADLIDIGEVSSDRLAVNYALVRSRQHELTAIALRVAEQVIAAIG